MLTDIQRQLWETYLAAENCAPRAEKLQALEAFIAALEASPPAEWFPWARSIAEMVVDQEYPLVIRQPLFERAIFPALLEGFRAGRPGNARWMAGLFQQVLRIPRCYVQLRPHESTEAALLRAAILHDPTDRRSKLRLIEYVANRLAYSLHELPIGVLYGIDGATPEQCIELERELDEFCRWVRNEEMEDQFADLIANCRFHFLAYQDYLMNVEQYGSYCEYVSLHRMPSGDDVAQDQPPAGDA